MAQKKKPTPPKMSDEDRAVQREISRSVRELLGKAKLSPSDKSKLRSLAGYMSDDAPEEYDDFMLMYLSGDRDWKDDYAAIFGDSKSEGKKYDITAVQSIKVID